MPKTKISEFSATAGNNTDIDGINIAEGCPPSGINDAIRELMAQLKDFQAGTAGDSFNGPVGTTTPAAGAFTNLSASGTFALTGDQVQISEGGTGQTTANAAFNALAPSQSTHAGKYLKTDGTNTSWDALDISTADITGTLPIANGGTGLTALGTGVQTALGIAVGSAGAFVVNGGALGTPSSGTVTNLTGTASININGTVGATTPTTGAFTTLSASGNITVSGGTANGVAYLNGSKVLTTGGSLTFDGTTLTGTSATSAANLVLNNTSGATQTYVNFTSGATVLSAIYRPSATNDFRFDANFGSIIWGIGSAGTATEQMRLTSTGLGIGTSSPAYKLQVAGTVGVSGIITSTVTSGQVVKAESGGTGILYSNFTNTGGTFLYGIDNSTGSAIFSGSSNYAGFIGTSGATPLVLATNGTVRATLDSSGNLGLGVTPSAWGGGKALQVGTTASLWFDGSGSTYYGNNFYYNSGFKYTSAGRYATAYLTTDTGQHQWLVTQSTQGANNPISFTQAMTLDASGRLLVGATSSLGSCVAQFTDPNGQSAIFNTTNADGSYAAWFNNGSANGFIGSGKQLVGTGATSEFCVRANTTLTFATSSTERARITSGGKLGLNTTSPSGLFTVYNTTAADFTSQANLENSSAITINSNQATSVVTFQGASGNPDKFIAVDNYGATQYFSLGYQNGATRRNVIQFDQNDTIYFSTAGTERARITSGGNLLVGTTTTAADSAGFRVFSSGRINASDSTVPGIFARLASDGECVRFQRDGTDVGSVDVTTTSTSYNTSSDYRLKNNPQPLTGSGAFIDALKPKTWNWAADGSKGVGFIAHEVQEVSPGSVVGEKDAVDEEGKPIMQAMEYGSAEFIANIIAELQSLRARVAQLEAK